MSGPARVAYAADNVLCDSSDYKLRFVAPPLVLFGGTDLVTSLDLRALETNAACKVGWRTAAVNPEYPGSWRTLLTRRWTNGLTPESVDVTAETTDLYVQVGLFSALDTGTTPKHAFARLWASVKDGGWLVARQRFVLGPSTGNLILPIATPFPCAGVTGLMFAFEFTGVTGTIDNPACVWRSFDGGDATVPNAWSSPLTTLTDVTADIKVNSGSLPITTTNKLMAQAGFQYATTGSNPNAAVEIVVAAKC